ncbi:MAG: 50S ribosomal protein L18 [Candidatus Levybacteria bacterium RBG_16_35_6]|nr:MAG: 50S ribosomal protein L18 [Candidatus Levybacteria bacterium RBG_16_35_6]
MNKTYLKRQKRIRTKITKSKEKPRLSVFRSNKFIYAQIIDDKSGKTLLGISEKELDKKGIKSEKAKELGKLLAKKATAKKIKEVVFDRGRYAYHGRVKKLAEGAREGGLIF